MDEVKGYLEMMGTFIKFNLSSNFKNLWIV